MIPIFAVAVISMVAMVAVLEHLPVYHGRGKLYNITEERGNLEQYCHPSPPTFFIPIMPILTPISILWNKRLLNIVVL